MMATRVKKTLLLDLDKEWKGLGFHRTSDKFYGDRFHRKADGITYRIHLSFDPRYHRLTVEVPYCAIRFDRAEELIAKHEDPSPLAQPGDVDASATLAMSTSYGPLGLFRKTWSLSDERDCERVSKELVEYAMEKSRRFFEQLSAPQAALRLLTSDIETAREYAGTDEMIAKKATALALLYEGEAEARRVAAARLAAGLGRSRSSFERWLGRLLGEDGAAANSSVGDGLSS